MSQIGSTVEVKKSRRPHRCWWCGEAIEVGTAYVWWAWYEDGFTRVKVHPECREAWHEMSREEGYPVEVMFGEFDRPAVDTTQNVT